MKQSPTSISPHKGTSLVAEEANPPQAIPFSTMNSSSSSTYTLKEFNRTHFQSLIECVSRLFCDDEQIVLLDFLTHEEMSFTESELIEKLGWNTKRFREVCASLEREKYILKEHISSITENPYTPFPKDRISYKQINKDKVLHTVGNTPYHYRINSHIAPVLQYRCQKMESMLEKALDECQKEDIYSCVKCGRQFDALQAQILDVHPDDAHFMCICGNRLEHEDNAIDIERITALQRQAKMYLLPLRKEIEKVWGMHIPNFPPYSKTAQDESKLGLNGERDKKNRSPLVGSTISNTSSNPSELTDSRSGTTTTKQGNFRVQMDPSEDQASLKKAIPSWLMNGPQNIPTPQSLLKNKSAHHLPTSKLPTTTVSHLPYPTEIPLEPPVNVQNPTYKKSPVPKIHPITTTEKAASYTPESLSRPSLIPQDGASRNYVQIKFKSPKNNQTGLQSSRDPRHQQRPQSAQAPLRSTHIKPPTPAEQVKVKMLQAPITTESSPASSVTGPNNTEAQSSPEKSQEEEEPSLFLSKYNKHFLLSECQNLQQEMTHSEFEKFTELQDEYLNDF